MKRTSVAFSVTALLLAMSFAPPANAGCGACEQAAEGKKHGEGSAHSAEAADAQCASGAKRAVRLGDKAPGFSAACPDTGKEVAVSEVTGENLTALIFWNQTCPFVVNAKPRIEEFQKTFASRGVKVVAIDAGINNQPGDVVEYGKNLGFPLLVNRDSAIAAQFGATKTPEVFLLDKDMVVRYHGAFDSGQPGKSDAVVPYVREAAQALLDGGQPATPETKAFGCSLKYAKGVKPLPAVAGQVISAPERERSASGRES
jgi:thiol-disulfide isomerase/thioredoxin